MLPFAVALAALAWGPIGCTSSTWCADCNQAVAVLGLNYQASTTYTSGTSIPVNAPNPVGGTPTLYTVGSGSLPPGLHLDPTTGQISGTPTAAGVFTFTILSINSVSRVSQTLLITVVPALPMALSYVTPMTFAAGTVIAVQTPTLTQSTPGLPTSYAITSGHLPDGLALQVDGTLTGTPTVPGPFVFTVTAIDGPRSAGLRMVGAAAVVARTASATVAYTVTPVGILGLSYPTPMSFPVGLSLAIQSPVLVSATPGIPTSYVISSGSLPMGLSLDSGTGTIAGIPADMGLFPFGVTATNGTRTATAPISYTIVPLQPFWASYNTPQEFAQASAIPDQLPTLANLAPGIDVVFTISTGNLPPGLTLNGNGSITGTPTATGVYDFTVDAANGSRSVSVPVTYSVSDEEVVGLNYNTPLYFGAGSPMATQLPTFVDEDPGEVPTFAITGGALPSGLVLNADGSITGTPMAPGVYTATITATTVDDNPSATIQYTVTPAQDLTITYVTPRVFAQGVAIPSQSATLTQEIPGVVSDFALIAGVMPAGLILNGDGSITGTPSSYGVFAFTIQAVNGNRSAVVSLGYTVTATSPLTISYTTPQTFSDGQAIATQSPSLSQEMPGITTTFAVTAGALPGGLTLNANGTITGTPSGPGLFAFTIMATNGPRTALVSLDYTVVPSGALTVHYNSPLTLVAGSVISIQSPSLTQETPGITSTFAITANALPASLTLNANGTITGTPTTPGVYTFTVTATNGSRTANATLSYTVPPAAALTVSYVTPKTFNPNVAIATQSPTVGNATPGLSTTFSLSSGTLPTGLSLNTSDGTITGTPTVNATSTFTVTATNGARTANASPTYTIGVAAPTALGYATPVSYVEKAAITANVPNPTGGTPTSYAVTLGSLPAGLSLNTSTGDITGTPSGPTAGSVNVTITGTNAQGNASQVVNITVTPAAPSALAYSSPVTYTNGTAITNNTPNPSGGTPTSYAITSGTLPAGLSIDPTTGIISGTPSAPTSGAVLITIRGTNATGNASQTLSITVNDTAPTALNYTTPNTYTDGTPILVNNPNPTGGTPNAYTITAGSLPAGLSLHATTGVISGTPMGSQTILSVTIRGSNGAGNASKTISNTVNATAPTALHYTTPVTYILNSAIATNEPNPVGGTPASYAVTSGTLPAGLTLNTTTGSITGIPTATTAGPVSVTIRGTNASGNVSQTISINVPVPSVVSFSGNPLTLPVGQKAELAAVFSGGTGTVDNGIGVIQSGANLYSPAIATPQSITYHLVVTNGSSPDAAASVTITWVTPTVSLTATIHLSGGALIDRTDPSYASDPFYGFKLSIPSQNAVCQDTDLTVMKDPVIPVGSSIPSPAIQVSEVFNLTTTIGYPFQKPATVTLPYDTSSLGVGDVPVSFYWDAIYSKWVANGIKSFDATAKRVTFTTLLPGCYVVLAIPNLASTLSNSATAFTYNVDGWFQPNQGVFDLPGGSSFGMSAFASWYYTDRKSTNASAGLYSLFRQGPIASDDVAAKALISRLASGTMESWSQIVDQSAYQLTDAQTGLALITALKVTSQPQIFLMGEARPVVDNALATIVYDYNATTNKFSLMDPNYPGTALTITWTPGAATGGWTAYDRAAGYFPTFTQYAMEGHTSIHRLVDYERAFQGANTYFPNPPFASISLANVGSLASPVMDGTTLKINDASSVAMDGAIANGDETAQYIYWSQNGGARTAVGLTGTSFSFNIGSLVDPYGTRIILETTTNPCDPTFGHSGFLEFYVKDQALNPWFANSCFEQGLKVDAKTPISWITEQGSNTAKLYPDTPTWTAQGVMNSYAVTFAVPSAGSGLTTVGNDPTCTTTPLPMVLDGTAGFRINHIGSGAQISRAYQIITVPTVIAHPQLSFYWSAVLQNAGHPANQQPYADVLIQDITDANNVTVVYFKHIAAQDPTYPGWQTNGTWGAIPWQKVSLPNLTSLKGHKLKIMVTAADCTAGGHGGYVYLDNIACN